jgi:hypothetical protein
MSKIALIKNNGTQECVSLQQVLNQCPNFDCFNDPGNNLNLDQLYQITSTCFTNLNHKISQKQTAMGNNQSGGGCNLSSLTVSRDGITVDIEELKKNLHQYLVLHNIKQLQDHTLLPFGIIISSLNLPNDFEILSELCPYLKDYLDDAYPNHTAFDSNGQIDKGVLIPIGVMLDVTDIGDINRLY